MAKRDLDKIILDIYQSDRRYERNAYYFALEAVDFAVSRKSSKHVTTVELLQAIRDYAFERYGALAGLVFDGFGLVLEDDFGEVIRNLVHARLLHLRPQDKLRDFQTGRDFGDLWGRLN